MNKSGGIKLFELQSCKITRREKRGEPSNMFTVHLVKFAI